MKVSTLSGLGAEGGGGDYFGVTEGLTQDEWVRTIEQIAPGAGISAATESVLTGKDLLSSFKDVLGTVALTIQQRQILSAQMDRMRAGLPPLDASQYGVGVSVGLSPEITRALLIGGGVLLAAIFLLRRK